MSLIRPRREVSIRLGRSPSRHAVPPAPPSPPAGPPSQTQSSPAVQPSPAVQSSFAAQPSPPAGRRRSRRLIGVLGSALAVSSLLLVTACAGSGTNNGVTIVDAGDGDNDGLHGTVPAQRLAKPALNLTDTEGRPFDLRERTKGKITLLFFGYTHCPDVCPTTMADISSALTEVKPDVRQQIAVVFVTSDPDRDTGPVLSRWLRQFDATFIGVRGTFDRIRTEAEALGVPLEKPEVQADGSVLVTHGSQVIAFSRDDRIRALYLAGTGVQAYIDDLPKLTAERSGPEAR